MNASGKRLRRPRYAPTVGCYADRGTVVMVMDPEDARALADHYGSRDDVYRELMDEAARAEREWIEE